MASFPSSGISNYGRNGVVYDPVSEQFHAFSPFVSDSPGIAGHSVYSGTSAFDQDDSCHPNAYHDARAYVGIEHADPSYVAPCNPGAPVPTTSVQAIRANPGHETRLFAMPTRSGRPIMTGASSVTCNPGPFTGPGGPAAASVPEAYTTFAAATAAAAAAATLGSLDTAAVHHGEAPQEMEEGGSSAIATRASDQPFSPGVSPGEGDGRHRLTCAMHRNARPILILYFGCNRLYIAGVTASLLNAFGTPRAVQLGGEGQAYFFVRNRYPSTRVAKHRQNTAKTPTHRHHSQPPAPSTPVYYSPQPTHTTHTTAQASHRKTTAKTLPPIVAPPPP